MTKTIRELDSKYSGMRYMSISPNLANMIAHYQLPFLRNNNWKCPNGIPLVCAPAFQDLDKAILEKRLDVQFIPGFGGSTNPSTLQIVNGAKRHPENPVYRFGNVNKDDPGPLIDFYEENNLETDNKTIIGKIENTTKVMRTCSHSESPIYCTVCDIIGRYRVFAVAHDLFAISTKYVMVGYGYQVTYGNTLDDTIIKETFKAYSKPEINSVLSCLMNNPADLHVFNIAQDPNLYWPIIWYYGSVHAALQKIGGLQLIRKVYHSNKITTTERVSREDIDEKLTAAFPQVPGFLGIICGNGECVKFDHSESFSKCGDCKTRRYCSEPCQRADWKIHKKECIKKEKSSEESEKKEETIKKSFVVQNEEIETEVDQKLNIDDSSSFKGNEKDDANERRPKWKGQPKRKQKKKKF